MLSYLLACISATADDGNTADLKDCTNIVSGCSAQQLTVRRRGNMRWTYTSWLLGWDG